MGLGRVMDLVKSVGLKVIWSDVSELMIYDLG